MQIRFKPHPAQQKILDSRARVTLANSGIQGGKTTVGAVWLINQMLTKGFDKNYLMTAPSYKMLNQSTLVKFFEILTFDGLSQIGVYKKMESEIVFKHGHGRIFIRSCDEPDLLEGMTIDGAAWLDEAGQYAQKAWTNILGRTAIARAPILLTTTPYFINWLHKEVYLRAMKGDRNYRVVEWRSVDSPYFPQAEYDERKATMNEDDFARRYDGEWRQISGLVYPDFDISKHVLKPNEMFEVPKQWTHVCGVDFGFTNPTAVNWIAIDNDNNYYIYDEYNKRGKTASESVEEMRVKYPYQYIKAYYCDPNAQGDIHEWINAGIRNIYGIRTEKMPGIRKVTEFLKAGKLKIFPKCINTIEEFQTYRLAPPNETKNMKEEPVKINDHHLDACRYVLMNTSFGIRPLASKANTKRELLADGTYMDVPTAPSPKKVIDTFMKERGLKIDNEPIMTDLTRDHI